jgi:murein L,D-transpeptidase YcbB/YkuD
MIGLLVLLGGLPILAGEPNAQLVLQDARRLLKNKSGLPLDVRTQADQLERYYGRPDAVILWLKPERNAELVSALAGLTAIGVTNMDPALSRIEMRKQALNSDDTSLLALVELTFSATLLEAAQHLRLGQVHLYRDKLHPRTLQRFIYGDRVLARAASGQSITDLLALLEPQTADYQAIRQKLVQFILVQKNGGWPSILPGPDLKLGDAGPRVADLRQRLQTTGYLPPGVRSETFDEPLAEGLRLFQRQHALPATGTLDRRTLLTLNVPVRDRIAQLAANLERWRWFEDIPVGQLWVINTNIARLELRNAEGRRQDLKISVGGACVELPTFDSTIDHVDFNPEYRVPQAIAARYVLPVLQTRPESLDPNIVLRADSFLLGTPTVDWKTYTETNFPFSVSQSPGPTNLLGGFEMPLKDEASVSLHGRPATDPKLPIPRTLWPACVALGSADAVSNLMTAAGLDALEKDAMAEGSRSVVLKSPVPVIFLYATVWLDSSGGVVFGTDPQGLDAPLIRKLTTTPSS